MEEKECGFRMYKKAGCICTKLMCNGHGLRGQAFQEILNDMMDTDRKWEWNSALKYFLRAQSHKHSNGDVAQALTHIFNKYDLSAHALLIGWAPKRGESVTSFICTHYLALAQLSLQPRCIAAIVRLQTACRTYVKNEKLKLQGPWVTHNATPFNKNDAFSMASIDDIPKEHRFSYTSSDGRLYAFSAPELHRYITAYEGINPFTREAIPSDALDRLKCLVNTYPISVRQPITVWRSPKDAFVDVLHGFERLGFYSRLEWFSDLSSDAIFQIFETLSLDRDIPPHLFDLERLDAAIMNETDAQEIQDNFRYALATTMRTIIRYTFATQFYTICRLFLSVSDTNHEMRSAIPQWLIAGGMGRRG